MKQIDSSYKLIESLSVSQKWWEIRKNYTRRNILTKVFQYPTVIKTILLHSFMTFIDVVL